MLCIFLNPLVSCGALPNLLIDTLWDPATLLTYTELLNRKQAYDFRQGQLCTHLCHQIVEIVYGEVVK